MAKSHRILTLVLLLPLVAIAAEPVDSETRDAAARIDYGFYTEDSGLIIAARDAIAESARDPWPGYLRAYASYRAAQLRVMRDRPASDLLNACISDAEAAVEFATIEAEAGLLIAACSALAAKDEPVKSVLHQRRYRRAMSRVESADPGNPRLLLLALNYGYEANGQLSLTPDAVLDVFRTRREPFAFPDWGEAEALVILAARQLEAGDRRGARDLIEAALINAPDYRYALELQARISSLTATN